MFPRTSVLLCLGTLAASLAFLTPASFARDLYWTEQQVIKASDIDGQNPTVIFDGATSTPPMGGNAVDLAVTATHIYWSGHSGGDIWRANRDGTGAVQLITGGTSVHFLAINETSGKIYFTDYATGLFYANLADGSGVTNYYNGHPGSFTGLALDPAATFTDEVLAISTGNEWLYRATPEWFSVGAVVALQGGDATYGLAYDSGSRTVYYTNFTEGTLRSYNFDTSGHKLLKTGLQSPLGVKLSPAGTHLLIAERGRGVSAFQVDNFGYALLAPAEDAHFGVAVTVDPAPLPPGEDPGDLPYLFYANFDSDPVGGPPVAGWSVSGPGQGTATVVEDTGNNAFGMGTENRFLRAASAASFFITASFEAAEVVTLSFDFIGRVNFGDGSRWLNVDFLAGGSRVHITGLRIPAGTVRTDTADGNPSYGAMDSLVRVDTIMNNSSGTITYDTPDGGTADLGPGKASLWVYDYVAEAWEHLLEEYLFGGGVATGTALNSVTFGMDSNAIRSYDLDNVYVFEGAVVGEFLQEVNLPPPPPPPGPLPVVWSLAPGDRPYISGGVRNRGMAIHPTEGYLAFVHRNTPTVGVVNGLNGAEIGTLSVGGITGGTFILNEIAIDEAGVIYAGNLATNTATANYRLYRWADKDADPELVVNAALNATDANTANRRFGDSLVVLGSGANTEIFLGTWAGTVIARLTPLASPGDPNNQFEAQVFTMVNLPAGSTRDLSPGPDGMLYGPTATGLHKIELDRGALTATGVGGHLLPGAIEPVGYSASDGYVGGIDTNTTEFFLYDAETFEVLAKNSFPTNNTYDNAHGQVVFGNGMVYALAADNGILAMSLDIPSGNTFASWIAGFDLPAGQDGPDDNPAGDGIKNLLKFALGLDPTVATREGLPAIGVESILVDEATELYLTLTFTSPDDVEGVVYELELSSELADWTPGGVLVESISNGDGTTTHTYRDSAPLAAAARRFMRLTVRE